MTLILGIKCATGIVMAADGAASLGAMGQMTAVQATKKLSIIEGRAIFGASGFVGLGQRIEGKVRGRVAHFGGMEKTELMGDLRNHVYNDILQQEFKVAKETAPVVGNPVASAGCISSWMVAGAIKNGELCLLQFDHGANPEAASDNLPFMAIGSGQNLADPFLAFVRRIFWPNRLPTIAEGEFAAWWTLHHAIKTAPAGIADPKQLIVLQKWDGNKVTPKELTPDECKEHEEAVGRVEEYLKDFPLKKEAQGGAAGASIPAPPAK